MRIMVVDDHALVRRGMTLRSEGRLPRRRRSSRPSPRRRRWTCSTRDTEVDLALVDVRMPDLDGLELLRAIKAEWAERPRHHALDLRERAVREARALRRSGGLPAEGRHARGPVAGHQRGDVGQRQRAVAAGDPEPVRGPGARPAATRERPADRVLADAARARHPRRCCPRVAPTARSRRRCSCPRRPSRRTWPRSSASWASPTGPRPR